MLLNNVNSKNLIDIAKLSSPPKPPPPEYDFPGRTVNLASVYPPPIHALPSQLPELPSAQRKAIWFSDARIPYVLTTHIVPAAYLREDPDEPLPEAPKQDGSMTKEERIHCVRKNEITLREMRRKAELDVRSGEEKGKEKVLWVCLNRYVRSNNIKGGLALFCAHAIGLHKETWEPTLLSLLSSPQAQSQIQEIWVWDAVNHGDSALLNAGKLNSLSQWRTITRDLLTFLIYYLPSSLESNLPTHLPRVSQSEVDSRKRHGFLSPGSPRLPVFSIGHSFGGCICTLAALSHPMLFTSITLIDPVIDYKVYPDPNPFTLGAISRRASWPNRSKAKKMFYSSPFFRVWDKRALELYIESALYDDRDTGLVRLKMPPMVEASMFVDTETGPAEAWVRLWKGELNERVGLRWIMPAKDLLVPRPDATQTRVWLRPKNASNVRVKGAGHLIVQEKPDALANEIGIFLESITAQNSKARL